MMKIAPKTNMIGPITSARFNPADFWMSASLAVSPTIVTITPKIRNSTPVKERMSNSLASSSVPCSPGLSSGDVMAGTSSGPAGADHVDGDVQQGIEDEYPAPENDGRPIPAADGDVRRVADLHPVHQTVQFRVRLACLP